jgi:hypothetical protein
MMKKLLAPFLLPIILSFSAKGLPIEEHIEIQFKSSKHAGKNQKEEREDFKINRILKLK